MLKKAFKLSSNPCLSKRTCPKILKIFQITTFDIYGLSENQHEKSI
jgi:hypothetical protein